MLREKNNMKLNLENVDGFVVDLTWNVSVKQQYKDIFGESENISIEDMRQAIIDYYTQTYNLVLCKQYNVFQIIESEVKIDVVEKQISHSDMVVASLENRCYKLFTKDRGFIFVEKYDEHEDIDKTYDREERERAKIYDEFGYYLDYISLDGTTNISYWTTITDLLNKETGLEILHSLDIDEDMITGDSVINVLKLYANFLQDDYGEQEDIDNIYERIADKNWTEKDLIEHYTIQKIGTVYFIILA